MIEQLAEVEELVERFAGRYFGKRRALVRDVADPRQLGRVRVYLPQLYGNDLSPWAWPCFVGGGGVDTGDFAVPPVNAYVWVEFEEGQPNHPIWSGGFATNRNESRPQDGSPLQADEGYQSDSNPVPKHVRGQLDGGDLDGSLKGTEGVPSTAFAGVYPHVRTIQTPGGHALEMDDTPGAERLTLKHKRAASIEFLPDGSMVLVTPGNLVLRSSSKSEYVEGGFTRKITGSSDTTVQGGSTETYGGKRTVTVGSDTTVTMKGETKTLAGQKTLTVKGSVNEEISGDLETIVGGSVQIGAGGGSVQNYAEKFFLYASDVSNVSPTEQSLGIYSRRGTAVFATTDLAGVIKRGVETGQDYTRIGNISTPHTSGGVPLLEEPLVVGKQLELFLKAVMTAVTAFSGTMSSGGTTPGYGAPNPVLAAASATLTTALNTATTVYLNTLTPSQPLILSESAFTSR